MALSDAEIYAKYADELVRFATFLGGSTDAGDLVSSAVLRALGSTSWLTVRNPRAYLYRAVLNEARLTARRESRRRSYEERCARPEPAPEVPWPDHEVLAAVAQLSERQRAVIYLAYWDDLAPDAIAELLGIAEGSVRRHLARARKTLRRRLNEH
jgi:RNA polymerase sigma factor (sigma-70 family)